jgi:hypothetical protein
MEISRLKIRIPSILMYIYTKGSYAFIAQPVFFAVVSRPGGAFFPSQVILVRVFADRGRVGLFYEWGDG